MLKRPPGESGRGQRDSGSEHERRERIGGKSKRSAISVLPIPSGPLDEQAVDLQ